MTNCIGKMVRVLLLSTIMVMLLAGFASAAESEQAVAVGATTGSSLRLREEPSTSASIVTTLNKGVAVAILDNTSTEGWFKISYNGKTGYVSSDYMIVDRDNLFTTYGRTNTDSVNVRADASTDSEVLASVGVGTVVTVNGFKDGWYDVTCKYGTEGYIRSDLLDLTSSNSSSASSGIVDTAKQYLGVRYVYGGASPNGFDCSGLVYYVLKQVGFSPYRTPADQYRMGTSVSKEELKPGDIVFFAGTYTSGISHVGIYAGNGQFIHAPNSRSTVSYSSLTSGYWANHYYAARRMA